MHLWFSFEDVGRVMSDSFHMIDVPFHLDILDTFLSKNNIIIMFVTANVETHHENIDLNHLLFFSRQRCLWHVHEVRIEVQQYEAKPRPFSYFYTGSWLFSCIIVNKHSYLSFLIHCTNKMIYDHYTQ